MNADAAQMNAERQSEWFVPIVPGASTHLESLAPSFCVHLRCICVHLRSIDFGPHHSR